MRSYVSGRGAKVVTREAFRSELAKLRSTEEKETKESNPKIDNISEWLEFFGMRTKTANVKGTFRKMNPKTLFFDNNNVRITEQAIILKEAESYGAVMAFSFRNGGCSSGPYESLNLSSSYGDKETNVTRNLQILSNRLTIESSQIITCNQEHGNTVVILDRAPETTIKGDAIIAVNPELYPAD